MSDTQSRLFSLIVPTIHRADHVLRLLVSIEAQTCRDFEVIIVDQNQDGLIDEFCNEFAQRIPLRHLKIESKGAAHARNHGLGHAGGRLINFPDDDCEFPPDLLTRVEAVFENAPGLTAIFGRAVDPVSGKSSVTRFYPQSQTVSARNLYGTTVEFTMFARRCLFQDIGVFDETLGVGTYFGSEEGADLVLRAFYQGKVMHYDPSLQMFHVQKLGRYDRGERKRAYNYGKGFGRLCVKHALLYRRPHAAFQFFHFQFRAIVAMFLFFFTLRVRRSAYYLMLVKGRLAGAKESWREFAGMRRKPAMARIEQR